MVKEIDVGSESHHYGLDRLTDMSIFVMLDSYLSEK